ncbi:inositol-pentakisphosphate 2-kinase [Xylariaceae sp. FL1019]|nr:inositol-pentakisphosphate 2-kinase [Xylariaceae sp. FL1019]
MGTWDGKNPTLAECEQLVNNSSDVDFEYVAEGRANAVFSIWTVNSGGERKRQLEGTLLRVPKETPHITPCDYKTLHDFHENVVEKAVDSQFLVSQKLSRITEHVAAIMNAKRMKDGKRDKDDGSVIKSGYAMFMEDMRESTGYSVLEFKPKWLAQSPIAPRDAKRCRTCAREAYRNSLKRAEGKKTSIPICPLGLLSSDEKIVAQTIERLAPEWPEVDRDRLAQAFKDTQIFEELRKLQDEGDPGTTLLDNPSDPQFGLAMTLRDCTCFVRMPDDTAKTIEIKLADVDKKNWEEKQSYWRESHENLVKDGWYTNDMDGETDCQLNR